jgi:glutaredoxin
MAVLAACALATPALAQFKWVGADGTITYGDRPPPGAQPIGQPDGSGSRADARTAALPYELRTAAQRHPVVLYVTGDCQPCEQARQHLSRRGIPHATREVASQRDAEAFQTLGFTALSFPSLAIGRERSTGYEATSWDRMLDGAGYPASSQLPRNWQFAKPEPLAAPVSVAASRQPEADTIESAGTREGMLPSEALRTRVSASAPESSIRF